MNKEVGIWNLLSALVQAGRRCENELAARSLLLVLGLLATGNPAILNWVPFLISVLESETGETWGWGDRVQLENFLHQWVEEDS